MFFNRAFAAIKNAIMSILVVIIFMGIGLPLLNLFLIVGTLVILIDCIFTGQRIDNYQTRKAWKSKE